MTITHIIWETDGNDVTLPTEVEVEDSLTDEEVADYLSETYGYLVEAFSMPMTDDGIMNYIVSFFATPIPDY